MNYDVTEMAVMNCDAINTDRLAFELIVIANELKEAGDVARFERLDNLHRGLIAAPYGDGAGSRSAAHSRLVVSQVLDRARELRA